MVALSRPHHFIFFALVLTGLFGATFQVTQAMLDAPPVEPASLPILVESALAGALPLPAPERLADLVVSELSARECVSSDPRRPGGLLTLLVRNDGKRTARGFALFAGLDVRNEETGDAVQEELDVWVDELAPGDEVVMQVAYRFPQRDTLVAGSVAIDQPVPGAYRIEATVDRPSALPSLGDVGILEESDEHNNSASIQTDGSADGVC